MVSPDDAGNIHRCFCGATITVPGGEELRRGPQPGTGPTRPAMSIPALVEAGHLPPPDCATCGSSHVECVWFVAQCEREVVEDDPDGAAAVASFVGRTLGLLSPVVGGLVLAAGAVAGPGERRTHGRDLAVPVPVNLCARCRAEWVSRFGRVVDVAALVMAIAALLVGFVVLFVDLLVGTGLIVVGCALFRLGCSLRRSRREVLVDLLSHVPEYAELFGRYPDADVRREWPR